MKQRILSLLLLFPLLFGSVAFAFAGRAAALSEDMLPVAATNEGRKTRILLRWEARADADGMQIYRSETGKRGSYEKIASVRGKTWFRDSGLSANSIYYYKLRSFSKTPDGYVYSPFETVTAATALTASFLKEKLNEAQTAAHNYLDTAMPRCKNGKTIIRTAETDDGLVTCRFAEVTRGSIRSTAKLKRYLRRFFSRDFVENFVSTYYCDANGGLYLMEAQAPDASYLVQSQTSIRQIQQENTAVTFDALLRRPDFNQEKNTFASFLGEPKQKQRKNKATGRIVVNLTESDWNLTLVNKRRELPQGFAPTTAQIFSTGYVLDSRVTPHYEAMYRAAQQDGCYLTPYSTYRSYQYQNMLFQNFAGELRRSGYSAADAARITADQILYPGTSEHQLGFAADIKGTGQWFAQTKEYRWLRQHAHEFGFIERYTAEKQPITGIIPEPWHWRYVGTPWAEEIKDSGLCLEEFLALRGGLYLTQRKALRMVVENGRWVFDCDEDGGSAWTYDNYAWRP